MAEMTPKTLTEICAKNDLYRTPELNDKLYLHYKGFSSIQNLEAYTGLRCLYLEGNGLTKIEGLEKQTQMRSLFLQENCIETIEGLDAMKDLDTLNLAQNFVETVENLSALKKLQTLNLAQNALKDIEGIRGLLECPSIMCLDIQKNKIDDPAVLDVLAKMPNLRVLYTQGNPFVKKVRFYRKSVIYRFPNLKYLDDRPVFDDDRARAVAWCKGFEKGGVKTAQEAEKAEMDRLRKEKEARHRRNMDAFDEMLRKAREERDRKPEGGKHASCGDTKEGGDDEKSTPARILEKAVRDLVVEAPPPPAVEGGAEKIPEGGDGEGKTATRLLRSRAGELFEIDASNRFVRLRGKALEDAETRRSHEIVEWDKVAPSQQKQLEHWPEGANDLLVSPFSGEPVIRAADVKKTERKIEIPGFAHWDGESSVVSHSASNVPTSTPELSKSTAGSPPSLPVPASAVASCTDLDALD